MSNKTKQHTVRLPTRLFEAIEMRALVNRRSVNKEIEVLLGGLLDQAARSDATVMASMQERASP
jgi:hypothetical protein